MKAKSIRELLEFTKRQSNFTIPSDAEELLNTQENVLKPSDVIGLTKAVAEGLIVSRGMTSRITREGKQWFIGTADFNPERLNLEIEDGKVVNAAVG